MSRKNSGIKKGRKREKQENIIAFMIINKMIDQYRKRGIKEENMWLCLEGQWGAAPYLSCPISLVGKNSKISSLLKILDWGMGEAEFYVTYVDMSEYSFQDREEDKKEYPNWKIIGQGFRGLRFLENAIWISYPCLKKQITINEIRDDLKKRVKNSDPIFILEYLDIKLN